MHSPGTSRILAVRARQPLRLAAAIGLTALMLWWAGPTSVWQAARGARWSWIGAALVLVAADRSLMAYRWIALLRAIPSAAHPRLRDILRVFFVSTYLGTLLPGSVGGDAARTYALSRLAVPATDAFASVFLDRLLGVLSLLIMALAGLLLARDLAHDPAVVVSLIATALVCTVAAAMIFSRHAALLGHAVASRLPSARAGRLTSGIVAGLQRYAPERGILTLVLAASVAVQVLRVLQAYCLGLSLHIVLPLTTYFAFVPIILLVMLLPISVNGLGTSQVAFVGLFARVGVAQGPAFALSVLFLALGVIGNLPGGLLYAFGSSDRDGSPATGRSA
jgi:glycosyltransferase 2 family protein